MKIVSSLTFFALMSLELVAIQYPSLAQAPYQPYPKNNPNDPNEETQWNPTVGRLEAACQVTANFNTCFNYYQLWCNQGFQQACYFQNLALSNPQAFQQAISANSACTRGDQSACLWLNQQFGN